MSDTENLNEAADSGLPSHALFACPFCDGRDLRIMENRRSSYQVVCWRCGAAGPSVVGKHELDMDVSMLTQTRAATGPMGAWQMRGGRCHTDPKHPLANAKAMRGGADA